MSVIKVVGKLRRSKLFITFAAIIVIYLCFSTILYRSDSVESVVVVDGKTGVKAVQSKLKQAVSNNEVEDGTENVFKEPEVPTLINFDLHDVVTYIKSFFQDQESALRHKLASYYKYLKATDQLSRSATINKNSEIEIDNFEYADYNVRVPDVYMGRYRGSEALPIVANYDIRFTVAVYLHYIKTRLDEANRDSSRLTFDVDVPFHWYDWVDITALNKYILFNNDPYISGEDKQKYDCSYVSTNLVRNFGDHGEAEPLRDPREIKYDPKTFCRNLDKITDLALDYDQNRNSSINFNVFKWTRKSSIRAKMLQSRSYLYSGAPTPASIIFLVDSNFEIGKQKRTVDNVSKNNPTVDNLDFSKNKRTIDNVDFNKNKPTVDNVDFNKRKGSTIDNVDFNKNKRTIDNVDSIVDLNKDRRVNNILAYEFPVQQGNTVGHGKKLLESYEEMVKPFLDHLEEKPDSIVNPLQSLQSLVEAYPPDKFDEDPEENDHEILVDNEDLTMKLSTKAFEYDHKQEIADLVAKLQAQDSAQLAQSPRKHLKYKKEQTHLDSLVFSKNSKPLTVKKHFHEVPIASTSDSEDAKKNKAGGHYDWRFFNGIIESELETRRTLHHLLRSFLKFTYAKNIPTWLAHGSLLSWYWNGMNFPWDYDIDVQMPIKDLHKFCKLYNNTLVVENINDGFGRFFVDCGAYLTHRTKEFGKNNIDARFIDVDKGIYIDITGLALTEAQLPKKYQNYRKRDTNGIVSLKDRKYPFFIHHNSTLQARNPAVIKPAPITPARIVKSYKDGLTPQQRYAKNARLQVYNCKNNHFVFYNQLSPLKLTVIEGTKGFVPLNFKQLLKDEYHSSSLTSQYFAKHFFVKKLRLWVPAASFKAFFKKLIKDGNSHYKKSLSKNLYAIDNDISDLLKFLEFDESVLRSYYLNQRIAKQHEAEMLALNEGSSTKHILLSNIEFKPILKDHFLHTKNDLASADEEYNGENMYDSVKGTFQMDQMTGDEDEVVSNGAGIGEINMADPPNGNSLPEDDTNGKFLPNDDTLSEKHDSNGLDDDESFKAGVKNPDAHV